MNTSLSAAPRGLLVSAFISMALAVPALRAADGPPVVAKPAVNAPVTVTDNGATWTMDNGIVKATINKAQRQHTPPWSITASTSWGRAASGSPTPAGAGGQFCHH